MMCTTRSNFKNTADTSKALRKMVEDGLVQRSGQGGKGSPFLYRVSTLQIFHGVHCTWGLRITVVVA